MPIFKNDDDEIVYTKPSNEQQAEEFGVYDDTDFAICDKDDVLKQVKFSIEGETETTTTLRFAPTVSTEIQMPDGGALVNGVRIAADGSLSQTDAGKAVALVDGKAKVYNSADGVEGNHSQIFFNILERPTDDLSLISIKDTERGLSDQVGVCGQQWIKGANLSEDIQNCINFFNTVCAGYFTFELRTDYNPPNPTIYITRAVSGPYTDPVFMQDWNNTNGESVAGTNDTPPSLLGSLVGVVGETAYLAPGALQNYTAASAIAIGDTVTPTGTDGKIKLKEESWEIALGSAITEADSDESLIVFVTPDTWVND